MELSTKYIETKTVCLAKLNVVYAGSYGHQDRVHHEIVCCNTLSTPVVYTVYCSIDKV